MRNTLKILLFFLFCSSSFAYSDLFCRSVTDSSYSLKLEGQILFVGFGYYEEVEQFRVLRSQVSISSVGVSSKSLALDFLPDIEEIVGIRISGDSSKVFQARTRKGFGDNLKGDYLCILDGYLDLSIGDDSSGGGDVVTIHVNLNPKK